MSPFGATWFRITGIGRDLPSNNVPNIVGYLEDGTPVKGTWRKMPDNPLYRRYDIQMRTDLPTMYSHIMDGKTFEQAVKEISDRSRGQPGNRIIHPIEYPLYSIKPEPNFESLDRMMIDPRPKMTKKGTPCKNCARHGTWCGQHLLSLTFDQMYQVHFDRGEAPFGSVSIEKPGDE